MSIPAEFLLVATLMAATGAAAVSEAVAAPTAPAAQVAQVAQYQGAAPRVTMSESVLVLAAR